MSTSWKSPYKERRLLINEINRFLKRYRATFAQQTDKIALFFEIACLNSVVEYYRHYGFSIEPQQLTDGSKVFRYKTSPAGYPQNFSYFRVARVFGAKHTMFEFEIRQNIPIQSAHDRRILITPDIAVSCGPPRKRKSPQYYQGSREVYFLDPNDVVTFFEAKHYNPSPELLVNFVGVVNEIQPERLQPIAPTRMDHPLHIAPALLVSGTANPHARWIKASLEDRYTLNIVLGLFDNPTQLHDKKRGWKVKRF